MKITNPERFYNHIRAYLFNGRIKDQQFVRLNTLLLFLQDKPAVTVDRAAYILATAHHETDGFKAMVEYASGEAYEGRSDLGNTEKGDGVRFKGRGYPHLTGRKNYEWASRVTGHDMIENPGIASDLHVSARLIYDGMMTGAFTGRGLGYFINDGQTDFIGARFVVNGSDKAEQIAEIANQYRIGLLKATTDPDPVAPLDYDASGDIVAVPDQPERTKSRRPFRGQAIACGSTVTVLVTAFAASGILPPAFSQPEVIAALSGALSMLASSFGLCHRFPASHHDKTNGGN